MDEDNNNNHSRKQSVVSFGIEVRTWSKWKLGINQRARLEKNGLNRGLGILLRIGKKERKMRCFLTETLCGIQNGVNQYVVYYKKDYPWRHHILYYCIVFKYVFLPK